jgi:large subunit ribosomal protein L4
MKTDSAGLQELEKGLKGNEEVNRSVMHQAILAQNQWHRQRSASSKTRAEVHHTTKKSMPQKGTGGARHGALSAPQMVKGGVAHGPRPVSFGFKMNKQAFRRALIDAVRMRLEEKKVVVVSGDGESKGKTKEVFQFLTGNAGPNALVCVAAKSPVLRAGRNIKRCKTISEKGLNPYDILTHEWLVISKDALTTLLGQLKETVKG